MVTFGRERLCLYPEASCAVAEMQSHSLGEGQLLCREVRKTAGGSGGGDDLQHWGPLGAAARASCLDALPWAGRGRRGYTNAC